MSARVTTRGLVRVGWIAGFLLAGGDVTWAQRTAPKPDEPKGPAPTGKTLENLQKAYQGENNAHARYGEFAKKADQEGYAQVASLFRAAARSEEIHARNHADVIKKLGATPKPDPQRPDVQSTRANLEAALKGESYERDTMYPGFIKQAREERNKDAMQTFNYALSAEAEHAKLFQQALAALESWKTGKRDFYVCSVCGNTVTTVDFNKCPVCFTPKEKYEKVN